MGIQAVLGAKLSLPQGIWGLSCAGSIAPWLQRSVRVLQRCLLNFCSFLLYFNPLL